MSGTITNFNRSCVRWSIQADPSDQRKPGHMPWGNSVRIQIDARCTIEELDTGTSHQFYLIAPCRKEWMYRDSVLIMDPGAEYRVIFSQERQLEVAMSARVEGDRPLSSSTSGFMSLAFEIDPVKARELDSDRAVVRASEGGDLIVAKTQIIDTARKSSALLEYPVRTMNYHPERERFQVDTGPLIFPDFSASFEHPIECCRLAHTVYNNFDYAEFVCRPAGSENLVDRDGVILRGYSELHQITVSHRLYAQSG